MEIQFFFIERCHDGLILYVDREVHIVALEGSRGEFPVEVVI